ncbi:hypothetical protein Q6D67_08145, partial [Haliea sp. E1-2-M8]|nr:hypothetical protein [Haliea sp. E1-2-M8]
FGIRPVRIFREAATRFLEENTHLATGLTSLESAPLIQLLPLHDARRPYPLSWEEQHRLFKALPDHLSRMCLFKVNTGCRDGEVCSLQWDWEIDVPELGTSVFLIPGAKVKALQALHH